MAEPKEGPSVFATVRDADGNVKDRRVLTPKFFDTRELAEAERHGMLGAYPPEVVARYQESIRGAALQLAQRNEQLLAEITRPAPTHTSAVHDDLGPLPEPSEDPAGLASFELQGRFANAVVLPRPEVRPKDAEIIRALSDETDPTAIEDRYRSALDRAVHALAEHGESRLALLLHDTAAEFDRFLHRKLDIIGRGLDALHAKAMREAGAALQLAQRNEQLLAEIKLIRAGRPDLNTQEG